MSVKRFWGRADAVGEWVILTKEEWRHAEVARVREGEAVELVDGEGNIACGVLEKNGVRVKEMVKIKKTGPEIVLVVGLTQGGTMEEIVQQAVEMGAGEVVVVKSRNAAPEGDAKRLEKKLERWERITEEACKQSGNAWRAQVSVGDSVKKTLDRLAGAKNIVAALGEKTTAWGEMNLNGHEKIAVWVGPEGDWAPEEYETLKNAGASLVSLGERVLRVPTACVAALSALYVARELRRV